MPVNQICTSPSYMGSIMSRRTTQTGNTRIKLQTNNVLEMAGHSGMCASTNVWLFVCVACWHAAGIFALTNIVMLMWMRIVVRMHIPVLVVSTIAHLNHTEKGGMPFSSSTCNRLGLFNFLGFMI